MSSNNRERVDDRFSLLPEGKFAMPASAPFGSIDWRYDLLTRRRPCQELAFRGGIDVGADDPLSSELVRPIKS